MAIRRVQELKAPNERDTDFEPSRLVDALDRIARAIHRLVEAHEKLGEAYSKANPGPEEWNDPEEFRQ